MSEAHGNLGQNTRRRSNSFAGETSDLGPPIQEIPIADIQTEGNPRTSFEDIEELAHSIEQDGGLLQPIVVRKRPGGFALIAGERRMRAFEHLKRKTIPAIVHDAEYLQDPAPRAAARIIENIQRDDLKPAELGAAILALLDEGQGINQATIAKKLGRSKAWVSKAVTVGEYLKKNPKAASITDMELLYEQAKRQEDFDERATQDPPPNRKKAREEKVSHAKLGNPPSEKQRLKAEIKDMEAEIETLKGKLAGKRETLARLKAALKKL